MEAAGGAAAEPAAWAAEPFAEPEPGSEELEAGSALDRVLRESVCQQQGWVRVYAPNSPRLLASPFPAGLPEPQARLGHAFPSAEVRDAPVVGSASEAFVCPESQDVCPGCGSRQG
ncbi:unnamed protein product [Coccothraustes coccothraustes]